MTTTDKLAEALRVVTGAYASVITSDYQTRANPDPLADDEAYQAARATLAEYEATQRAYFPADYIREKLEKYDSEIADGTVSYPFYAGVFSQVARGMLERIA